MFLYLCDFSGLCQPLEQQCFVLRKLTHSPALHQVFFGADILLYCWKSNILWSFLPWIHIAVVCFHLNVSCDKVPPDYLLTLVSSVCRWLSNSVFLLHPSASRAQQVPAVSQSAYSPSSSDTGESMLANSPQTVLTKSLPPANIMGLPPTQPTTKVRRCSKIMTDKSC